jgi:leucyl/phenylalanyl-tRNA--protein transferase
LRDDPPALTPDLLLQGYCAGVFPMSESRDDPDVFWVDPKLRGILPLDGFHISRRLARFMRKEPFRISLNTAFEAVVHGCADRPETWINDTIFDLYRSLHHRGQAHAIEVWDADDLVGGVYGVTIGAAFFGESMFSTRTNASKVALAYLVDHLNHTGFTLFDTQFITDHLASLGGIEIPRRHYHTLLQQALQGQGDFQKTSDIPDAYTLLQRNTQTS